MRDSFVRTLSARAAQDSNIVLITGDLGFGVLTDFAERFPDQFINAGVAEQNMAMLACGMALDGAKVFTYSIANFPILRCLEQLRNDVCYHQADVTSVSIGGGFSYGPLGMSHIATEDLAIMRALPNMTVVAPTDDWEAGVLTDRIVDRGGPCYLRLDKSASGLPPGEEREITVGRARTVREGTDATLIATGGALKVALEAADTLRTEGVSARVLAMHTVKPLDVDAIRRAAVETHAIVTVEEHTTMGGLGGAVAETVAETGAAVVRRVGLKDEYPSVVGDQEYLRETYDISACVAADAVRQVVAGARR